MLFGSFPHRSLDDYPQFRYYSVPLGHQRGIDSLEDAVTPEQVRLVQSSMQKVLFISEIAAELFYRRLFELDPALRSLFYGDIKEQGRKLIQMLHSVVDSLGQLHTILPEVEAMARRHVTYGVQAQHYDTVGAALLWTLEQGLGNGFTAEVRAAWTEAYALLAGAMQKASA